MRLTTCTWSAPGVLPAVQRDTTAERSRTAACTSAQSERVCMRRRSHLWRCCQTGSSRAGLRPAGQPGEASPSLAGSVLGQDNLPSPSVCHEVGSPVIQVDAGFVHPQANAL